MPTDAQPHSITSQYPRAEPVHNPVARSIGGMSWGDLGGYVRRERNRRQQTVGQFAREIGLSPRPVTAVENGQQTNPTPDTCDRLEIALGWQVGSVYRVARENAAPTVVDDPDLARLHAVWTRLRPEVRAVIAECVVRLSDI